MQLLGVASPAEEGAEAPCGGVKLDWGEQQGADKATVGDKISKRRRGQLQEYVGLCVSSPRAPSPRTNRTRRVPHPVLIGHAASLTPY